MPKFVTIQNLEQYNSKINPRIEDLEQVSDLGYLVNYIKQTQPTTYTVELDGKTYTCKANVEQSESLPKLSEVEDYYGFSNISEINKNIQASDESFKVQSGLSGGASLELKGKSNTGSAVLTATNGADTSTLTLSPNGSLKLGKDNIVRSVNGVNADASGNVSDIVESGSNFIRYANGVQLCWGLLQKYTITYSDHQSNCNLPKPFKDTNYTVQTTAKGSGEEFLHVEVDRTDKSYFHCSFIVYNTYSDGTIKALWGDYTDPFCGLYLAIGYWK